MHKLFATALLVTAHASFAVNPSINPIDSGVFQYPIVDVNVGLDYQDYPTKDRDLSSHSVPSWIVNITHRIWEEKEIGLINETYDFGIVLHIASQNLFGIGSVIAGTMATLQGFPDRTLIAEEVIYSNSNSDAVEFSSHRIKSTVTNAGIHSFASETNHSAKYRTAVDCKIQGKNRRITEEWLVRDNLYLLKQLKQDPFKYAKQLVESGKFKAPKVQGIPKSRNGQLVVNLYQSSSEKDLVREYYDHIFNGKYFNRVSDYFHENAVVYSIENEQWTGISEIQNGLINLTTPIPNGLHQIDNITINQFPDDPTHLNVAVRSRLSGIHEVDGRLGPPSGRVLEIMMINHYEIQNNKIIKAWITWDALDAICQTIAQ